MRTVAFDGQMGASGDMILGALVGLGADPAVLEPVESALGVRYVIDSTVTNGIEATTVDVLLADEHDQTDTQDQRHTHDDHDHSHTHDDHDPAHLEGHDHTHAEGHGPHRSYTEVLEILESIPLSESVRETARGAFRRLGEAEAAVHGRSLEAIQFHEVGADDAIADIVGAALLFEELALERIVTTPLSVGGGDCEMSHGTYPVPGPAVLEIAEDAEWSISGGPVAAELLTPTGAALMAQVAEGLETLPALSVETVGYGAGTASFENRPNVLRATLGDGSRRLARDSITVLETNLDDAAPEVLGGLQETLTAAGARDVSILPVTMKKSRPGHLVKVICKPKDAERIAHRLALETGTLGIREHGAGHRWTAHRRFETVVLEIGDETHAVTVKIASTTDGEIYDISTEYDDAAAVARETGKPIVWIMHQAETLVEAECGEKEP